MGYCHCRSCRSWSGGPVNAFTLWKPDAVKITAGAEHVGMFQKTPVSQRQYCKKCGGHLMTNHPPLGLVDVFSATLPTLKYTPGVHVNYAETVLPMKDGLPKFRDFPADQASRSQSSGNRYRMAWTRIERSKPLNETSPRSWKARPFPMQSSQTTFDTRLCSGCAWEQRRASS